MSCDQNIPTCTSHYEIFNILIVLTNYTYMAIFLSVSPGFGRGFFARSRSSKSTRSQGAAAPCTNKKSPVSTLLQSSIQNAFLRRGGSFVGMKKDDAARWPGLKARGLNNNVATERNLFGIPPQ
jgi:hypothetical protein